MIQVCPVVIIAIYMKLIINFLNFFCIEGNLAVFSSLTGCVAMIDHFRILQYNPFDFAPDSFR